MSQDRRTKRDTKTVDYKKLNSKGMASGDDDCYSSAEESELDKTIAHLRKRLMIWRKRKPELNCY